MVIVVWDPEELTWRFAMAWAFPFGLSGAVLHFNRVPAFITAFLPKMASHTSPAFFDDFRIVERSFTKESRYMWFAKAADFLGWNFDPSKDHPPSSILPMLGCFEDWSRAHSEYFAVHADPERIATAKALVEESLATKRFSSRAPCQGKQGAVITPPFQQWLMGQKVVGPHG